MHMNHTHKPYQKGKRNLNTEFNAWSLFWRQKQEKVQGWKCQCFQVFQWNLWLFWISVCKAQRQQKKCRLPCEKQVPEGDSGKRQRLCLQWQTFTTWGPVEGRGGSDRVRKGRRRREPASLTSSKRPWIVWQGTMPVMLVWKGLTFWS